MWYAASEIIFFLIVAAVIGGAIGFGAAQIYQIDFESLTAAWRSRGDGDKLKQAGREIEELRRRLEIATDALRGDSPAPGFPAPLAADGGFPPPASSGHVDVAEPVKATPDRDEPPTDGRRLSERVADATAD